MDAAGDSAGRVRSGIKVIYSWTHSWPYIPWPTWLGVMLCFKLTVLMGLGPLVTVYIALLDTMETTVVVELENMGTVMVCMKVHGNYSLK